MAKRKQIGPSRPAQSKPLTIPPDARLRQGGTRIPGMNVMGRETEQVIPSGMDLSELGPLGDLISGIASRLTPSTAQGIGESAIPSPGALGVTTFLKGGVPDIGGRATATITAMQRLANTLRALNASPEDVEQIAGIARKYPRVMAHMDDIRADPQTMTASSAAGRTYFGESNRLAPGRSIMKIYQPEQEMSDIYNLPGTFVHELTHGAQNVGAKGQMPQALNILKALGIKADVNPWEVSARTVAQRKAPNVFDILTQALQGGPPQPAPNALATTNTILEKLFGPGTKLRK